MKDLAVKYRPLTFKDVAGQQHITQILESQIKNENIGHAYIFAGPSGDGKTTTARIYANMVNKNMGGIIEIDGASNNGIDNIRELRETCQFKPIDTKYKVYIIDECHMLSTGAFNGLLKTLEEPPKHCIFILCTTDPQKIPATIISRCQRFDFRKVSDGEIENRLNYIVLQEGIQVLTEVTEYISKLANGGMRRAINLLETCINYPEKLTMSTVANILGVSSHETLFDLYNSIISKDMGKIINIIETENAAGKDIKILFKQLIEFSVDICKIYISEKAITKIPNKLIEEIKDLYKNDEIKLHINILDKLININTNLKYETDIKNLLIGELITL